MKILLLSQWYPPEPMKLLSDLTATLQELGHTVTVLTGFPNWPSGRVYPGYRLRLWQRETLDGVSVIRVALFPDHSRNPVRRALNFISFAISAAFLGPWLVQRPDAIHVVHPPITVGLPAWVLSRWWRIPFTMEIQDMWPENLESTGMVRSRRILGLVGAFASWVYRGSVGIRVISPGFLRNLIEKRVPPHKVRVISNWVDADYYSPREPNRELAARYGMAGRFNVLYAGTIGLAQGLDVVLAAAESLRLSLPDVQFVLAGDGLDYERLKLEAQTRGLSNVRFLGRLTGDCMPALYACANVLFLHLKHDPLFAMTIPHKVFTYLASSKPVLVGGEGDVVRIVVESRAGLACAPSDPDALANSVAALYSKSVVERDAMGKNGRQVACANYGRRHLVGQIAELIQAATRS